jgi:hypothetical protein
MTLARLFPYGLKEYGLHDVFGETPKTARETRALPFSLYNSPVAQKLKCARNRLSLRNRFDSLGG